MIKLKGIFACFLLLLVLTSTPLLEARGARIEFRYAGFWHSSSLFRHIYGNWSSDYQLEADIDLCGPYEFWANFDYFTKSGRSIGLHSRTRANIAVGSIGYKYLFQTCRCFTPYVGLGISVGGIWIDNKLFCCGKDKGSKASVGAIVKSGVYYNLTENLYLDFFVDYSYQPVKFHKTVDLGGVKTGIGLGLRC